MIELLYLLPIVILGLLLYQEKRDRSLERAERDLKEIGLLERIGITVPRPDPEPSDELLYVPETDQAWDDYAEARASGEVL